MSDRIVTHTGPVFRVESILVTDARGNRVRRDIVRHPGAVAVVPVRDDGRVVLIRNFRVAVGRSLVECCAGKLESGEDPARAALRELEEECGYSARTVRPLGEFFTSPGFADERMRAFLAEGLTPVPQRLEPGEEIEVFTADEPEIDRMLAAGEIEDGKTIAALALWRLRARGSRA